MPLLTTCSMGHEENLSHREMAQRLEEGDFGCRHEGCDKMVEYPVDKRFWERYITSPKQEPFVYLE